MTIINKSISIDTPIRNILELLKQQIDVLHINKLKQITYRNNNAIVTCPIHKDGNENTPSCEILLEDKGHILAGTVHCFGCGYKANIVKFIADCLDISYRAAIEWLLSISDYSYINDIRDIGDIDFNNDIQIKNNLPIVTLDELKSYDYIHPYMFTRKLTEDIIDKFEVGYDPKTDCLTFPVYYNGECLFVAKRKVKYKKFIMPEITPKPIYGLDYITNDEIYITESVINALTIWSYGKQALALFGTGSNYQAEQLNKLYARKFILALDPDEAGEKGCERLNKKLTNKIVSKLIIPKGKDINDLSKEEFFNLKESFI